MLEGLAAVNEAIKTHSSFIPKLKEAIGRVVVGQENLVDGLLTGLLANGHVLLEGVPGLAKTLSVKTLSAAVQAEFQRIQRSEEHTSELQSRPHLVCRLLLEKKKTKTKKQQQSTSYSNTQ